jgi:hypothetical protein
MASKGQLKKRKYLYVCSRMSYVFAIIHPQYATFRFLQ